MTENYCFEHISDIWSAFDDCNTVEEIEEIIENIPGCFGKFSYELLEDGRVRIHMDFYDKNLDIEDSDEVDFYIFPTETA